MPSGMFEMGRGWAVEIVPLHTFALTVAGIAGQPRVVDGQVQIRVLSVTASVDHDTLDGAPAAWVRAAPP